MGMLVLAYISVPAYSVPATTNVSATPLIPSANASGSSQYLNPIVSGPIAPVLMQIARMKKTMSASTLILPGSATIQPWGRQTYNGSQNSISPYAKMPRFESTMKMAQNIRIQPHCGTTCVQNPMTREIALYSFART
jgi:hypothetical protein